MELPSLQVATANGTTATADTPTGLSVKVKDTAKPTKSVVKATHAFKQKAKSFLTNQFTVVAIVAGVLLLAIIISCYVYRSKAKSAVHFPEEALFELDYDK